MNKILYVPLDERPCNYANIERMFRAVQDIELVILEKGLLPDKKKPSDTEAVWRFVEERIGECSHAVLSAEMLFYGGLLPSRIHGKKDEEEIIHFSNRLRRLKEEHLECRLSAFSLIMRTPRYSSSEQEPDYYEKYGEQIFRLGVCRDKESRGLLTEEEKAEYRSLKKAIPEAVIRDFEGRRAYNQKLLCQMVMLVKEGVLENLDIPQDDSFPYGYTAMDQREIYALVREQVLGSRVLMYPGADEAGYTLTARAVNQIRRREPLIYSFYSSIFGGTVVPKYEDRPIGESLKSHVLAVGGRLTEDLEHADVILAYNTPAGKMLEAGEQDQAGLDYDRERNLPYFVREIVRYLDQGRNLSVCDCAYANGGDFYLISLLARLTGRIMEIKSYHAWNTNCNTLGSVLAESCIFLDASEHRIKENLISSIFEDVFYEGKIRKELMEHYLPEHRMVSYFDIRAQREEITELVSRRALELCGLVLGEGPKQEIEELSVGFPWNRLFNGDFQIRLRGGEK